MDYNMKYPYLLPKSSHFTKLVVVRSHEQVKHNGVKETLNNLTSEFWISRSRDYIKKIIHECVLCKHFEGQNYDYPEAPLLPEFRVKKDFAFSYTGIDYVGPLFVKNISFGKDVMFKCWLVLFTCCNSRCIYLDLVVPDCSAETCVSTLKRFINSRDAPKLFVSDDGSAFISTEVQEFVSSHNIRWLFKHRLGQAGFLNA